MRRLAVAGRTLLLLLTLGAEPALTQQYQYQRPLDTAPSEKTIGGGYVAPQVQHPRPRAVAWQIADVTLLAVALGVSVWLALWRRRRAGLVAVSVFCLAYFGFYREGCICPIGSTQNVAVALVDPHYAVPHTSSPPSSCRSPRRSCSGASSAAASARSGRSRSW